MDRKLTLKVGDDVYYIFFTVYRFKVHIYCLSKQVDENISEYIDFEILENRILKPYEYLRYLFDNDKAKRMKIVDFLLNKLQYNNNCGDSGKDSSGNSTNE